MTLAPPYAPHCWEHTDSTCWSCQGTGCEVEHPANVECFAGCCEVCVGEGFSKDWLYNPDCEECVRVNDYWRDVSQRGDAVREGCSSGAGREREKAWT